jgi:hypothetical protein
VRGDALHGRIDAAGGEAVSATDADGFNPPPSLHQGPKKRAAKTVKVYPSSPAQRERWKAKAAACGLSVSAWLATLAEHDTRAAQP